MKRFNLLLVLLLTLPLFVAAQDEPPVYRICTEILLDEPDDPSANLPPGMVAKAVAYKSELGKYWENGHTITVRFLGGTEAWRSKVRRYAQEWSEVANINFAFIEKGDADVRVSFTPGMGTWSLIGTDARRMAQNQPTMNYGWFNSRTSEADFRSTVLHEFGHSLGLLHEHQHPKGGIPWDKVKLYQFYRETQGWDKSQVDQQVLGRLDATKTQYTAYDPHSIMHYPIPNELTIGDFEVGMNRSLSPTDRAFVAKVYPKRTGSISATPTKPTTPTRPSTGTTTPTKSRPSAAAPFTVAFRDVLPEDQKREQVWLTLGGITKTFVLDASNIRTGMTAFNVPKSGRYAYEIYTKTTFVQRVDGRLKETTLRGYGKGTLTLRNQTTFDLVLGKRLNDEWFEVKLATGK